MEDKWYDIPGYNYQYNPVTQQVKSLPKPIFISKFTKEKILKVNRDKAVQLINGESRANYTLNSIHRMVFPKVYKSVDLRLVKKYCTVLGLSYDELDRAKLPTVIADKVAAIWYHLRHNHGLSAVKISTKFFKDRTSVHHGIRKYQNYLEVGYDDCQENLRLLENCC